jgi:DNA-directed RNA polymerase delta subunit
MITRNKRVIDPMTMEMNMAIDKMIAVGESPWSIRDWGAIGGVDEGVVVVSCV